MPYNNTPPHTNTNGSKNNPISLYSPNSLAKSFQNTKEETKTQSEKDGTENNFPVSSSHPKTNTSIPFIQEVHTTTKLAISKVQKTLLPQLNKIHIIPKLSPIQQYPLSLPLFKIPEISKTESTDSNSKSTDTYYPTSDTTESEFSINSSINSSNMEIFNKRTKKYENTYDTESSSLIIPVSLEGEYNFENTPEKSEKKRKKTFQLMTLENIIPNSGQTNLLIQQTKTNIEHTPSRKTEASPVKNHILNL